MIKNILNNLLIYLMVGAVIVIVALGVSVYTLKAQRDAAVINYQRALDANQANMKAIAKLEKEKKAIENALAKRMKEQARLEELFKQEEEKREREIEELRRKYETVDNYLDIPVPDELRDWLLQGGGQNRSSKNDSTSSFNSAQARTFLARSPVGESQYWGSA